MSRFIIQPGATGLTALALLGAAAFLLPVASQAQTSITPEQALLNIRPVIHSALAPEEVATGGVSEGGEALLNRSPARSAQAAPLTGGSPARRSEVDGERALLGRQQSR